MQALQAIEYKHQRLLEVSNRINKQLTTLVINNNWFNRFIAYYDANEKTIATYTRALRPFFLYLQNHKIKQPPRATILAYRAKLQAMHKATTVQAYMSVVRLFFRWTANTSLYPNIADKIKGAKVSKEHKKDYLTSSQVKSVLAGIDRSTTAGKRDYAMLALMTTTGMRTIELLRANVDDMRTAGDSVVLYVQGKGKTDKADYVKLPAPVEQAIRVYMATRNSNNTGDPLFQSISSNCVGSRLTTRSIRRIVKIRFIATGYDSDRLTAHSLRHTAVTLSLLAGQDITEVQQFARHANINTTMVYNHAIDKANNKCADAVAGTIF